MLGVDADVRYGRAMLSQIHIFKEPSKVFRSSYVDGPYWQALFGVSNDLVCFGHMSGLLVRAYDRWP